MAIVQLFGQRVTDTFDPDRAIGAAVEINGELKRLPKAIVDAALQAAEPGGAYLPRNIVSALSIAGIETTTGPGGRTALAKPIHVKCWFKPIR